MENDLIFGNETSDMMTGSGADYTQIAAVPSAEAPYDDALTRPFDAAQVVVPEGENVVRVPVTPGEVVELPFPEDAQFLARIDNGNLAIKVGDVTVILQGYVQAAGQTPPVIEAADGKPLDIATILASTDPNIDIQTAAGPAAGAQGQGADNTGAILTQFGEGAGLGGFLGAGALGGTDGPGNGPVDQTGTLFRQFGLAAALTAGNDAPVAKDDTYLAIRNTPLVVPADKGFLVNDSDPDGDPVTATLISKSPTHGSVVAFADGHFTYTPDAKYFGADSFDYQISDGKGGTDTATVNLYVDALPERQSGAKALFNSEDHPNHGELLNWVFKDEDDGTQPTVAVDKTTLPDGVTYDPVTQTVQLDTFGKYDYLAAGESVTFIVKFVVTDAHGGSMVQDLPVTITGAADPVDAVDDNVLTNVGVSASFVMPEWAVIANDKDISTEDVAFPGIGTLVGGSFASHAVGVGTDGSLGFGEDATLGGSLKYELNDGSQATISIQNQQGGDLTGTAAHEIIVSGSVAGAGDKIDGKGGNDVIFGGAGDDTVIFNHGDIVQGGGDSIANSNALATSATRGDVLVVDHTVNFTTTNITHFDGVETISTAAADGGVGTQSLTIGAASVTGLSDHTITPGGVFAEHEAVRIDGDAVDQLYLSISKDPVAGGGWADTGVDVNGYHVFAHETTAGSAATADAYVMVQAANVANVHLNQDAPATA
jgi:hypothetical protein